MKGDFTILISGRQFGGKRNLRMIAPVVRELLDSAEREIQIATYVISAGGMTLIKKLRDALNRGVSVKFIINSLNPDIIPHGVRKELMTLQEEYPHFTLIEFEKKYPGEMLHAKVIVVDREKAIIGSMNLTRSGLNLNHEVAVLVEGKGVEELAYILDTI